jgi:hypothetical protein
MVSKGTNLAYYDDWLDGAPSTVTFYLYDNTAGTSTRQVSGWSDIDSQYVHYVFTFLNLKDHNYSMTAIYNSYYGGPSAPNSTFQDGPNTGMTSVQMPYRTGHDSTGHSADFQMYF